MSEFSLMSIICFSKTSTRYVQLVERLATSWSAFKTSRLSDVKWCQPKLTVRVKHLAGSKTLRHATVKGLAE
jgi:hypothetical protein